MPLDMFEHAYFSRAPMMLRCDITDDTSSHHSYLPMQLVHVHNVRVCVEMSVIMNYCAIFLYNTNTSHNTETNNCFTVPCLFMNPIFLKKLSQTNGFVIQLPRQLRLCSTFQFINAAHG